MVAFTNTYDIGDDVVPTITNTALTGDAITIGTPTGSPTITALTAAGVSGGVWNMPNQGCRLVSTVTTEVLAHSWTKTAASTAVFGIMFKVDSANYPGTASFSIARLRSASANVCKLALSTTGVIQLINSAGGGLKNFNANTAAPNGWYYADAQVTVATSTTGVLNVQLYTVSTGVTFDTYASGAAVNMGTANVTSLQWGKPEAAATAAQFDFDNPRFDTGTTTALGLPTPIVPPSLTTLPLRR